MTQYVNRMVCIAPNARIAGIRTFIASIDPTNHVDDWFTAQLSATGNAPATHSWASFVCNNADLAAWQTYLLDKNDVVLESYVSPAASLVSAGLNLIQEGL